MDGCGVRRSETATLRIQHVNGDTGMLSVQFGKGGTSRPVPWPHTIHGDSMRQFETVRALPQADLQQGDDGVLLPAACATQATAAARALVWPWCVPAHRLTRVEARRDVWRDHGHASAIQRAITAAKRSPRSDAPAAP